MKLPKPSDSNADFKVPEPGVYRMRLTDYDEPVVSTFKKKNGDDQYRIKLVFTIEDPESDFHAEEIWAWFGWSMHPKSRLYPVVKALLARDIDEDEEPDLDDLVGKAIMGTVDNTTRTVDGMEKTYANLVAASPVRRKKGDAPPKPDPKPEAPKADEGEGLDWGDENEDAA